MLLITRAAGQSAVVGNELLPTVTQVETERVCLAVFDRISPRFGWEPAAEHWLYEGDQVRLAQDAICRLVHIVPANGTCRLGFTLPPGTTLHRKEVYDALTTQRPVREE